jgi:4-carboxymuconolactone decarboxylase
MTRLAPLDPPYTDEISSDLERLMGAARDVEPLALFRTIAHNPIMLGRFRQIGSSLLSFGSLEAEDRELVIHRTTARCGAGYEWGVHARIFAGPLGLGEDWLRATWHGDAGDAAFSPRHQLLARAVDELHDTGAWSDETAAALRTELDDARLVELVCLVGFYHLVSFCCGAFALEPEPWAVATPAA